MNNQMLYRVRALGYCCPYAFFFANQEEKEIYLAELLRVSDRTIRFWRRKLREETLTCGERKHCLLTRKTPEPPASEVDKTFLEQ